MYCGVEGYAEPTGEDPLAQNVYCANMECENYDGHIYTGTLVIDDGINDVFNNRKEKEDLAIQEEDMNYDPWKHKSQGMRCKTCMWFAVKEKKNPEQGEGNHLGRCRKNAPTINGWPVVFVNDWCGDHKIDEEKL